MTGKTPGNIDAAGVSWRDGDSIRHYTWQSGPLTHGQTYRLAVRIATAAHPSGLETQNTDPHPATADATAPATPILGSALAPCAGVARCSGTLPMLPEAGGR